MKKGFIIFTTFLLAMVLVSGFSSSASAASSETQTYKFGSGYALSYYAELKEGAIYQINTYFNVNEKGITITSADQQVKHVIRPMTITKNGSKIVVPSTNGTNQTAKVYGDLTLKPFEISKAGGSQTETHRRITMYFTATKIDKAKKTVAFKVSGTAQ